MGIQEHIKYVGVYNIYKLQGARGYTKKWKRTHNTNLTNT